MSAAWFTRVPVRIHTFTGQVWATKKGLSRLLLRYFDVLIGFFSTIALTDSPSQFNFLVQNDVLPEYKLKVIGFGSICGVDAIRFQCDVVTKQRIRLELNISKNSIVLLYVGRLNKDKGLFDLAEAFNLIAELHPEVVLLLVGSEEEVKFSSLQNICHLHKERLRYIKFTAHPEHYMVASDIFCLPSYREGFGLTIIEAAACGLPSVASRIYGITDAVIEGHTGLMFPAGDVNALAFAVRKLLTDLELRLMLGENARLRAQKDFSSEAITQHMLHIYDELTTSCIV
jgi:glycosyltransferase involved in cell wall biosynthesis